MTENMENDRRYTVRRLRPEDAPGVVQCIRETYGESYPSAYLYDPQRIVELAGAGTLISVVSVEERTGDIIGHVSALRFNTGTVAEAGQGAVKPAHRGADLFDRMILSMYQEARGAGLQCLLGHAVTSHTASQVIIERTGSKMCGLTLGSMPGTLDFKNMTGVVAQRESCFVSMIFLVPPEPVSICASLHHRDMVARIYAGLNRPVAFRPSSPVSGYGEVSVSTNPSWGTGDIQVRRAGTDIPAQIERCLADLTAKSLSVIYLELPFDAEGMDEICRAAEDRGFFFAAVGPSSATDGMDSLYLQYLNAGIDLSRIRAASPEARRILEYVAAERQRVGRGR